MLLHVRSSVESFALISTGLLTAPVFLVLFRCYIHTLISIPILHRSFWYCSSGTLKSILQPLLHCIGGFSTVPGLRSLVMITTPLLHQCIRYCSGAVTEPVVALVEVTYHVCDDSMLLCLWIST